MKIQITMIADSEEEAMEIMGRMTGSKPAETETEDTSAGKAATQQPAPAEQIQTGEATSAGTKATDVDKDGMPYNADYHASPPQFGKTGLWRAKRGQADAAKQARASFKAGGGNVQAPEASAPTDAPAMPGATAMPGAANIPTRAPVSFDQVFGKVSELIENGKLTTDQCGALYEKTAGTSDGQKAAAIYGTNETSRAALWDELTAIESQ